MIRLISKIMTSQPGNQTIAIHILPNISGSKTNQAVKFGQLIEYNTRKHFLEKSYAKCGGNTIPRSFSKKSKLSISLDQKPLLKNKKRSGTSSLAHCLHLITFY